MRSVLRLLIICGGPSLERGISMNSARSVCDHLQASDIELTLLYYDQQKKPYRISLSQIYANTPSDFDFKLNDALTHTELAALLQDEVDLAFPLIHGEFGEDGQIQQILTKHGCPFIGLNAQACSQVFDKFQAVQCLKKAGLVAMPQLLVKQSSQQQNMLNVKAIDTFFKAEILSGAERQGRAVVKPVSGGSSIGVSIVKNSTEAQAACHEIFTQGLDSRAVIEPFCQGREFTVIVLQNSQGNAVALLPTEIELLPAKGEGEGDGDNSHGQLFDYRKKYLATQSTVFHSPPRFQSAVIAAIRQQAQFIFKHFAMHDCVRLDGWVLENGQLWFSDINPCSGMEQNSFFFIQCAQLGLSHAQALRYVVACACRRYGIDFIQDSDGHRPDATCQTVNVIFGGSTAERHVSLMSGTNVWLKLRSSKRYQPVPHFLDADENVWRLPYSFCLYHTTDEIFQQCLQADKNEQLLKVYRQSIVSQLGIEQQLDERVFLPQKMTLPEFIKRSSLVFIALHGGMGENGELQAKLEKAQVAFSGSGSQAAHIAMDKYATAVQLAGLEAEGISTADKHVLPVADLSHYQDKDYQSLWQLLNNKLCQHEASVIVKPRSDGCSAGIARISGQKDLQHYCCALINAELSIAADALSAGNPPIEMPTVKPSHLLFETFIISDDISIVGKTLNWVTKSNLVEITVGLLGKKGQMKAFNPSITLAKGSVLSLEEKFQGGTGVNITPLPSQWVKPGLTQKAKKAMERVANTLGMEGFARIDAFLNRLTGELIIIEVNSIPGLTPSTVLYHQALAEQKAIYPTLLLERILDLANFCGSEQ